MSTDYLFEKVDNSGLVVFRIVFGFLLFAESAGAIATGWVKRVFIDPEFTFTFIGFEWLQPLPDNGMYIFYGIMTILGLLVMFGAYYKASLSLFTLLWTATYLMQKTHYNNHYYLLILLCGLMLLVPAHAYKSYDARRNPNLKSLTSPRWAYLILILQLLIVFTYGAIAKMYPDWFDGTTVRLLLSSKTSWSIIGSLFKETWMIFFIAYGGIFFDLLIIPILLWKKTRFYGFLISIFFHLFNSAVFQVGIFPYLMIGACVLFFDPEKIRSIFLKNKPSIDKNKLETVSVSGKQSLFMAFLGVYFTIQVLLPLRHHLFTDDVLWTEEGHRMSWRMMLRIKSGDTYFLVKDYEQNKEWKVYPRDISSTKQSYKVAKNPDMMWQAIQHLKTDLKTKGHQDFGIFIYSEISVNDRSYLPFTDSTRDMTNVKWKRFKHADWILKSSY